LSKKYGTLAPELKAAFADEADSPVDLQVKIMELIIFHSSSFRLLETVKKKCPTYGYRLNYVPDLYDGLRGSYHGAELAYFFDNFDRMDIPYTEKNRSETQIIQNDWLQFVKTGAIEGRDRYDETGRITNYDAEITSIPFPKENLIRSLSGSSVFERVRRSYIANMKEEPTGKA